MAGSAHIREIIPRSLPLDEFATSGERMKASSPETAFVIKSCQAELELDTLLGSAMFPFPFSSMGKRSGPSDALTPTNLLKTARLHQEHVKAIRIDNMTCCSIFLDQITSSVVLK